MKLSFTSADRWVFALMFLMVAGCGNGDRPPLGTVTGTVTLSGEPLKNVEITFSPDIGRPSYGKTNGEGRYELDYINDTKGAKVGKHTISIRSGKVAQPAPRYVEIKSGKNTIDINCKPNVKKGDSTEVEE